MIRLIAVLDGTRGQGRTSLKLAGWAVDLRGGGRVLGMGRLRLDKSLELTSLGGVAELAQRLHLELANALAGQAEALTDLF